MGWYEQRRLKIDTNFYLVKLAGVGIERANSFKGTRALNASVTNFSFIYVDAVDPQHVTT